MNYYITGAKVTNDEISVDVKFEKFSSYSVIIPSSTPNPFQILGKTLKNHKRDIKNNLPLGTTKG